MFLAASCLALLAACKKDEKITPVTPTHNDTTHQQAPDTATAKVAFQFNAMVQAQVLKMDSTWYVNAAGDSITVSKFNYYISNIKFTRNDGYVYAEHESYRINRHSNSPCTFTVSGVPEGTYYKVEFSIGVDSVRNSSGAQVGALDISQGMYWDWATGYVFFKLEGKFKSNHFPNPTDYVMHVGTTPNYQTCQFNLGPNTINAVKKKQSLIVYSVHVDEIFANPVTLDMNTYHAVSGGPLAGTIARNYKDMFNVTQVVN